MDDETRPSPTTTIPSALISEQEVVIARTIAAPPALVFQAWTEPALVAQWWGPKAFTNPVCRIDPRPGGAYRIVMRSPEEVDYPLKGIYLEIIPPKRIIMTVDINEHPGEWHELLNTYRRDVEGKHAPELTWTVTFDEENADTRLTIVNRFASDVDREAMLKMGMGRGWNESLDQLEALLAK